jgi:hypothetical protein
MWWQARLILRVEPLSAAGELILDRAESTHVAKARPYGRPLTVADERSVAVVNAERMMS